jgi:hypothetical protein
MSFFKAEDFKTVFSPPMGDDDLDFIAGRANKKRDEVREILEDELIKVRAEIERLRAENARLQDRAIIETLREERADNTRLREAVAECGAVLVALIYGTTWELAPSVKETMVKAEAKARAALGEKK